MPRTARKYETDARAEKALRLTDAGLDSRIIAERLGISRVRVNQIVRDRRVRDAEQNPADR